MCMGLAPFLPRTYLRLLDACFVHCPVMWWLDHLDQLKAGVLSLDSFHIFLMLKVLIHISEVSFFFFLNKWAKFQPFENYFSRIIHVLYKLSICSMSSEINIWTELHKILSFCQDVNSEVCFWLPHNDSVYFLVHRYMYKAFPQFIN